MHIYNVRYKIFNGVNSWYFNYVAKLRIIIINQYFLMIKYVSIAQKIYFFVFFT